MTFQELKDKSNDFQTETVFNDYEISPETADLFLTLNTRNRALTKHIVKKYAKHMNEGTWLKAGQTVIISRKGTMLDGQHRLEAIKTSGTTQPFIVVTGVDPEVFKVLDTGKSRSAMDALSIIDPNIPRKNLRTVFRVLRYIITAVDGKLGFKSGGFNKVSNNRLSDFYDDLPDADRTYLDMCISKGSIFRKKSEAIDLMDAASFSFIYWTLSRLDKEKADFFCEALASGEHLSKDDNTRNIYLLRDKLLEFGVGKRKIQNRTSYRIAFTFKAWNAYIDGRRIERLLIKEGEDFQTPHGVTNMTAEVTGEVNEAAAEKVTTSTIY